MRKGEKPFKPEVEKILIDQIMDIVKGGDDYGLIVETLLDGVECYAKLLDLHQITPGFDFMFRLKEEEKGKYKRMVRFSHYVGNKDLENEDIIEVELFIDSKVDRFNILAEELELFILRKIILVDE